MVDLKKAHVTKFTELTDPKWIRTRLVHYVDPLGTERDWECCSRATRPKDMDCDGVAIIAIIETAEGPSILLQKQFRAPTGKICIELPAGLIDPNETVEVCAERELQEETGYYGKAINTSALIYNDPGFCDTNQRVIQVSIDMKDPRNQNPKPNLEENEFIECFTTPLKSLPATLDKLAAEGYVLDARVAGIAQGISLMSTYF
ncbi:ADP-ribose diphosphatase [Starmerella bacillaris]|uniref:ADP-ribose diphosphatase n=1 Tax=Starmerella bacillaris TaxID=1247836 RepID=A0AAV5REC2_STABA|nr:ADP-ribose diphosphatase [Starmerella bacillaris]